MTRKKSDFVLLIISIFSIAFGISSLIGDIIKVVNLLQDGFMAFLEYYSFHYMEIVGIVSYLVQTFVGITLLYIFIKKGTNKNTKIVLGIIYAGIVSQAIDSIYSVFYNFIWISTKNGTFTSLMGTLFNKNGLDLLIFVVSLVLSGFVFRASHRKKMKTEFVLSIVLGISWLYFASYSAYQAFFGGETIELNNVLMSLISFIISLLMLAFYIIKLVEVSNETSNETFFDYFEDADYDVVKEKGDKDKIRLFTTRVKDKKKDRILRTFTGFACLLITVSTLVIVLLNTKSFFNLKNQEEFNFNSLDDILSLIFAFCYLSFIPYGLLSIYGCIRGNANYYRYINGPISVGSTISLQAFIHYSFLIPSLFEKIDITTIIGIVALGIYYMISIIVYRRIGEANSNIAEADLKGDPYYDNDKDRIVTTIYTSIYSLVGLVLFIFMDFSEGKMLETIPYLVCFCSILIAFVMVLLNFKNRSNEYFGATIEKKVLLEYEAEKSKMNEGKPIVQNAIDENEEVENQEKITAINMQESNGVKQELSVVEGNDSSDVLSDIKNDINSTKHKILFSFLSERRLLTNPFFYVFIIAVPIIVFCIFYFFENLKEGVYFIIVLSITGASCIAAITSFIQTIKSVGKLIMKNNGSIGANYCKYSYLELLENYIKTHRAKIKNRIEEVREVIREKEKDASAAWIEASLISKKYDKYLND